MLSGIGELALQKFRLDLHCLLKVCCLNQFPRMYVIERSAKASNRGDLLPDDGSQLQHLLPQILYVST